VCRSINPHDDKSSAPKITRPWAPISPISVPHSYIIIATATAPPSIKTISLPILAAAAPDWRPGWPVVVVAGFAPAVPLGVGAAPYGAGMTVTAVTVLWLPSGKVVVWRIVEVIELEDAPFGDAPAVVAAPEAPPADAAESLGDAGEPPFEGDSVTNPPPTVLMIVAPDPSIVVTTAPGDAEESLGDAGEPPLEADSVTNPPPTVLMIVAPDTSIVVTTAPGDVTTPPGDVPAPADVAAGDELASLD